MRKTTLFLLSIIFGLTISTFAISRLPYGYGEAKWGMEQVDVQNKIEVFPFSSALSQDKRFSTISAVYTDDKERSSITYYFYNEKLFLVDLDIKRSGKDMLKDLRYKYGRPVQFRKLFVDKDALYYETMWMDKSSRVILQESQAKKDAAWKNKLIFAQNEMMDQMPDIASGKVFHLRIKTRIKSKK